jgi:hypothetical protein
MGLAGVTGALALLGVFVLPAAAQASWATVYVANESGALGGGISQFAIGNDVDARQSA